MTPAALLLTGADIAGLLDLPSCIDAVEAGLSRHDAGQSIGPAALGLTLSAGSFHVKAAALRADGRTFIAAKANVNLPGNPARTGRPTIQGVLILSDADDGRALAVMDSAELTTRRTAAVGAVAARHLARADAAVATVVGCGPLGEAQLRAMALVRSIRRAWAIDIDAEKARRFAARLSRDLDIDVEATTNLPAALDESDLCATCTTSERAVLRRAHLHPGLFVAAMGADNPRKHEIDAAALAASRVVVDSLEACVAGGDLHHAIASGTMAASDVHGELAAVVSGRVAGRTRGDEVFVFDSTGTAVQDVAAAIVVYQRALERDTGLAADRHGR
jgi:ornithine cyclodeaminase/alanine dehydrogenase-like protein (mu-crystallin family)